MSADVVCYVCVQFVFVSSGVGTGHGAWLCVSLGIWHPYKQANTAVWNHWHRVSSSFISTTWFRALIFQAVQGW